jgi:uncharacterized protein YndB with AHSA1/START domain
MEQFHVEAQGVTRATPDTVWALLADADGWSGWGPWNASGYESRGDQEPVGVGAIRVVRRRRTKITERVLEVEAGRRMAYTVVSGLPVRNYRGEVTLTATDSGTRIRWTASWDRTVGGQVVLGPLRGAFRDIVAGLVAAADRAA